MLANFSRVHTMVSGLWFQFEKRKTIQEQVHKEKDGRRGNRSEVGGGGGKATY